MKEKIEQSLDILMSGNMEQVRIYRDEEVILDYFPLQIVISENGLEISPIPHIRNSDIILSSEEKLALAYLMRVPFQELLSTTQDWKNKKG